MNVGSEQACMPATLVALGRLLGAVAALVLAVPTHAVIAQTHELRAHGRKLIEAEAYSEKSSAQSPRAKESDLCSGSCFLGYFWPNQWFELKVNAPEMLNYSLSLRASSEEGTQLKVLLMTGANSQQLLATIDVPKTQGFKDFKKITGTLVGLPKGVQTLRFYNAAGGVDVDYLVFAAGSEDDVVSFHLADTASTEVESGQDFRLCATGVRYLVSGGMSGPTHIEAELQNVGSIPLQGDWKSQLAILEAGTGMVLGAIGASTDVSDLGRNETSTIAGSCDAKLEPGGTYQIGLRVIRGGADAAKSAAWDLDARQAYLVLDNDLEVIDGAWGAGHTLQGGWNIIGKIERQQPMQTKEITGPFFPLRGSFRPVENPIPRSTGPSN